MSLLQYSGLKDIIDDRLSINSSIKDVAFCYAMNMIKARLRELYNNHKDSNRVGELFVLIDFPKNSNISKIIQYTIREFPYDSVNLLYNVGKLQPRIDLYCTTAELFNPRFETNNTIVVTLNAIENNYFSNLVLMNGIFIYIYNIGINDHEESMTNALNIEQSLIVDLDTNEKNIIKNFTNSFANEFYNVK